MRSYRHPLSHENQPFMTLTRRGQKRDLFCQTRTLPELASGIEASQLMEGKSKTVSVPHQRHRLRAQKGRLSRTGRWEPYPKSAPRCLSINKIAGVATFGIRNAGGKPPRRWHLLWDQQPPLPYQTHPHLSLGDDRKGIGFKNCSSLVRNEC